MEVALAAGAHYVDLGGLFHVAREQLGLDERFREAGLLAVLGMGSTPGKTNVMAARAVELLGDDVERIVVGAAGRDPTRRPARWWRRTRSRRSSMSSRCRRRSSATARSSSWIR